MWGGRVREETAPHLGTPILPAPPSRELHRCPRGSLEPAQRSVQARAAAVGGQMCPVRLPSPKPAPLTGPGQCIIHGGRADFLRAAQCLCIEVELTGG